MGLFDFLKRRSTPTAPDTPAADLPEVLFAAAERGDDQGLAQLCKAHRQAIKARFPSWSTVPVEIRNQPDSLNRYCQGLIAIAIAFQQAGDTSLLAQLSGPPTDNPITVWEQDLAAAQEAINTGKPEQGVQLLQAVLGRVEGLRGSAVDNYLPKTHGMLGVALYQSGDTRQAIEHTRRALELCQTAGDAEGIGIYGGNLRQMGVVSHTDPAASAEPSPVSDDQIIFQDSHGRRLTVNDLAGVTGTVRWEIIGKDAVPPAADRLHADARQAGAAGEFDRALDLLITQASRLAPAWPYPLYDAAFTHLLRGDAAAAETLYEQVDGLAPRGFFTAKTALDCLRRERQGWLPRGAYLNLVSVEWTDDPAEKRRIVDKLLVSAPDFPAAWKELSVLSDDPAEQLNAIDRGLSAAPDAETEGILRLNRAMLRARQGDRERAIRELGELAVDPASTLATEHLAKAARRGTPSAN